MANRHSNKLLTSGYVWNHYGPDRSVDKSPTGIIIHLGKEERTPVNLSSLRNQQVQQSSYDQGLKSWINHQEHNRNVPGLKKMETSSSTTQKLSNNYSSTTQVNNRTTHKQLSPIVSYNYSPVKQILHSHNHDQYSLTNYQTSSSHDSFKYIMPLQEQTFDKVKYTTHRVFDETDVFYHNLARAIQHPSDILFNESLERYPRQHMPVKSDNDFNHIELTDIRYILNLIEQDYLHTIQPYVSGVTFKKNNEDDQVLVDIGSIALATIEKGYTRQTEDIYHRQVPARRYIDTNSFSSSKKMHSKNSSTKDQHSLVNRRKHRTRHRDVSESFNTVDAESQTDNNEYQDSDSMMHQIDSSDYHSANPNEFCLWNHDNYQHSEMKHDQNTPCEVNVVMTEKTAIVKENQISSPTRECVVCFVEQPEREFYPTYSEKCRHTRRYICNKCTSYSVKTILDSGISSRVACPEINCLVKWNSDEIRRVLLATENNLLLRKYDAYLIKRFFENQFNFFWCAHECGSGQYDYRRLTRNWKITCSQCKRDTCAFHRVKWHEGMTCEQYDRLYPSSDTRTRKWIKKNSKKCPRCQCNIEKDGGCDHITCQKCRYEFCWDCLIDYSSFKNYANVEHKINCRNHPIGKFVLPMRFLKFRR
ncbi:unnamed protein product [Rotaria sordida]|uniref:RBR-type E3 ubiquitin transferase n=1 Tax=Rotaria sordida TaxID=392033 RepID=A0A815CE74_9BILA|nr:unnamed protein product [Rotaria sordida]